MEKELYLIKIIADTKEDLNKIVERLTAEINDIENNSEYRAGIEFKAW